jgi:uncharacterized membrane protein
MKPLTVRRARAWPVSLPTAVTLHYLALSAIVLVGAYLRLTALRRQSLWFDEIDVVVRAQRPLDQVLRTFVAAGENGPLYNILLALWVRVAGISEIAVRLPSAVAGVLAIPLIYLLGRRLAGANVGLLAAGLLSISPYHIWYSQEAKMYTMVVLLGLVSSMTLVEALERNDRLWWAAYAISTSLMFYTHVATVLVFGAQTLYVLATYRHWRGRERGWLVAAAVLTVPYIPVALWALKVIGGGVATWQPDVGFWEAVHILGVKFAVNRSDADIERRGAILYALLAVTGVAVLVCRRRPARWWLLLTVLVLGPVIGLWLVSLRQSVFSDRYAIVALPAYLILVAAAATRLIRSRLLWPIGALAVFLLLTTAWVPIRDVNRSSQAEKEDWRSAYADLANRAEPGDVVIVHPGYIITTWAYFSQREPRLQQYPVVSIPTFKVGWLSEPLMVKMLHDQAPTATRFWLVQSPVRVTPEDPDHTLQRWLSTTGQMLYDHEVNGVRITLYELPSPIPAP